MQNRKGAPMTDDPRIRPILRRQFRIHVSELARAREDRYWAMAEKCESPIERLLLAPLMFIRPLCLHPRYEGPLDVAPEARLHVQHKVGPYRLDFAYIVRPAGEREPPIRLAIEVDGHAFHSTREQREDDNSRHLDLKEYGYELIRFTGTQIHRDPERCAQDVSETVDRIYAARIHDLAANHNSDDEDAA
jgi:very-short-patch-repair endonuclease